MLCCSVVMVVIVHVGGDDEVIFVFVFFIRHGYAAELDVKLNFKHTLGLK